MCKYVKKKRFGKAEPRVGRPRCGTFRDFASHHESHALCEHKSDFDAVRSPIQMNNLAV